MRMASFGAVLLAGALLLAGLTGCSNTKEEDSGTPTTTASATTTTVGTTTQGTTTTGTNLLENLTGSTESVTTTAK